MSSQVYQGQKTKKLILQKCLNWILKNVFLARIMPKQDNNRCLYPYKDT